MVVVKYFIRFYYINGRVTLCDSPEVSFFVPSNSHSHAAGGAQRGEDCRDDACKNLQECLYAFFLHSRFNFKVKISF